MPFEQTFFLQLNNAVAHYIFLQKFAIFFGEYWQYVLLLVLAIIFFYPKSKRAENRGMVIVSLFAACVARWVVKTAILLVYHRPRPFALLQGVHQYISTSPSESFQSFPSGHTIFFFALATSLFMFNKKLGWWFFAAAFVMGVARVMAGIHWPTDILGGAILGILVGWVVYKIYALGYNKRRENI